MSNSKWKDLDKKKFVVDYNNVKKYPSLTLLTMEYNNISETTVKSWARKLKQAGFELIDRTQRNQFVADKDNTKTTEKLNIKITDLQEKVKLKEKEIKELKVAPPLLLDERIEVKKMKDTIKSLQSDLREAEKQAMTSDHLAGMIHGMKDHSFGKVPNWLTPKKSKNETHGIPVLFMSDIHFDEVVASSQIGFVNEYNREVATKRIQHTFNTSIDLLFNKTVNPKYDGMVIAFGGDMLSGNIHEELAETNEDSIQRSLLALTDLLIDGIDLHLKHFKRIFIPCVVGNHGRHHQKKRMKNKVFDNYEWLIYQFICRHYKDDDRITMLIPDGPDAIFNIYDKGFLLTHGDQFRGGSGISGIFTPLMLGRARKQQKSQAIKKNFDVMMIGHFHQYIHTNQLIVNGSIKGYDEFANEFNFSFERPQQALFINHPRNGMVIRTPILCDSYLDVDPTEVEKLVVFK